MPNTIQIEVVATIRETEIFEIPEEMFRDRHNGDYGSLKRELEQVTRERNADLSRTGTPTTWSPTPFRCSCMKGGDINA